MGCKHVDDMIVTINPIGSMGLVYLPYIYHKHQPFIHAGKYTVRPMDPMGTPINSLYWTPIPMLKPPNSSGEGHGVHLQLRLEPSTVTDQHGSMGIPRSWLKESEYRRRLSYPLQMMATRNPVNSPVEGGWWLKSPFFTGFYTPSQVVGLGISEPSTVSSMHAIFAYIYHKSQPFM